MDLTVYIVLLFESIGAVFVPSLKSILFVPKGNFSAKLMCHGAHEDATKIVIILIPLDHAAVWEVHLLVPVTGHVA